MRNPITRMLNLCTSLSNSAGRLIVPVLGLMIGLGSATFNPHIVVAASPETAPPQLKNTLKQIDAAASRRNIQAVMQFYSPKFTHTDGLNRQNIEKALTQLWKRYPKLTYRTELKSWESQGNSIVAETVTYVTGKQLVEGKDTNLESVLRSRQHFEAGKLVKQEILAERTEITAGKKPPTVELKLPEQVRTGQDYNFDAVVKEPLGKDLLMGTAIEESVTVERYFKPNPFEFELLQSGGIFKLGQAPAKKGNYWVSAILIRSGGMTQITQRLQVLDK